MKTMTVGAMLVLVAVAAVPLAADEGSQVFRLDHAVVTYGDIDAKYAEAIARTVEAARATAAEQFGFDMPDTVKVRVTVDPKGAVRLYNDGQDRFFLTVRSTQDLAAPSKSGIFHLYGLCHETGHLAMYRLIRDHSWLSSAAAESWAHYLGSRIVDQVHGREGADLWPDGYDYLADGTQRLERQLKQPGDMNQAARLWKELVEIAGDKGIAPIFAAWGKAEIDPTDPAAALRRTLLAANEDKRLVAWWNKAEPLFVVKRPKSEFAARTASPRDLAGQPMELAHDAGTMADKRSIAGSGHVVRFEAAGDTWYLTTVSIHGSRYGLPAPPKEDFHVWLCDEEFKVIAEFAFPYAAFERGEAKWVPLKTRPTNVPSKFIVCVGFNPTATKGVYVSHDAEASGNSLAGLPGRGAGGFGGGDWMIRVQLDQPKAANPLQPAK